MSQASPDRPPLAPMDGEPPADGATRRRLREAPASSASSATNRPPAGSTRKGRSVERAELAPVMAEDGSGLPYELWQGLSLADVEGHFAALEIPPRSAALHELWRRLITSSRDRRRQEAQATFNSPR